MKISEIFYILPIAVNLVLGALVLTKGIFNRINQIFFILIFFLLASIYSLYMVGVYGSLQMLDTLFWTKIFYGSAVMIAPCFLVFSYMFPEGDRVDLFKSIAIFAAPAVILSLLPGDRIVNSVLFSKLGQVRVVSGPLMVLLPAYFLGYTAVTSFVLAGKHRSSFGMPRLQIKYIFFGALYSLVALCVFILILYIFFAVDLGWKQFYAAASVISIFFTAMATSAILKHRFTAFNLILGKGILYTILAGFMTALYFGFLFLMAKIFQGISGNYSIFIGLLFFFVLSVLFEPLHDRLKDWIDRIFFRTRFDYETTLKETSSAMSFLTDRDRFFKLSARIVAKRMGLTGSAIFLYDQGRDMFEIKGADGLSKALMGYSMSSNYPLIEYLGEVKAPVFKYETENVANDIFLPEHESKKYKDVLGDMTKLGISLCVPCVVKEKMVAFIALGSKLSGDAFDEEDLNFLTTFANQSAIFIENALLLENEKEAAKALAEAKVREEYTSKLEKVNKELLETREELVKAERLSTLTKLSVSLQHEINNPLTSVIALSQALLLKIQQDKSLPVEFIEKKIRTIEGESKKIRDLLRNLANITEPIIKEYMPGVEMIDIKASAEHDNIPQE